MNKVQRKAVKAATVALLSCSQVMFSGIALAQTVPISNQETAGSFSSNSTTSFDPGLPPTNLQPPSMPAAATISPVMHSELTSGTTYSGTNIIDIAGYSNGQVSFSGNFANEGSLYLWSSNAAIGTATISATNIYNQMGATISTMLPANIITALPTTPVSNLNLVLIATGNIVNAGTIISAGSLTADAGGAIMNALPTNITGPMPIMQSVQNMNLIAASIANSGSIASVMSNINIASHTAQNLIVNNVGGILSAAQGTISIHDPSFVGKFDTLLLGGSVVADQLKIYSGKGVAYIDVEQLLPALSIFAGDAYVKTNSNLTITNIQLTDDPVFESAGNVVFKSEKDEDGNDTGICEAGIAIYTVAGSAIIDAEHPVHQINAGVMSLTLGGDVLLGDANISSSGPVLMNAGTINVKNLSSGSYVSLNSRQNVNAQSIISGGGVFIDAGHNVSIPAITVTGGGNVDVKVGLGPLAVGGPANIGAINVLGSSGIASVRLANTGGDIILLSPTAIQFAVPATSTKTLALDAGLSSIILPGGTIALNSSNFNVRGGLIAMTANSIVTNGTVLSAMNTAGGSGGIVAIGATSVNGPLTIHSDGITGFVGLSGRNAVTIQSQFVPGSYTLNTSYNGAAGASVSFNGDLTATANGHQGVVFVDGGNISFAGNTLVTANAVGASRNGGYVELFGSTITNSGPSAASFQANGGSQGFGGEVFVRATNVSSDLAVGHNSGQFKFSATGGEGGAVNIGPMRNLSVDGSAVDVSAQTGNGGFIFLGSGASGVGTMTFTGNAELKADGAGVGSGGTIRLRSLGQAVGSDLILGEVSGGGRLSAKGGSGGGSGGFVDIFSARNLSISGNAVHVDAFGDGNGGFINGVANGTVTGSGTMKTNGSGSGFGGQIRLVSGTSLSINGATLQANGGDSGSGGIVGLQGPVLDIGNDSVVTTIEANGGSSGGFGGYIQLLSDSSITVRSKTSISVNSQTEGVDAGVIDFIPTSTVNPFLVTVNGELHANSPTEAHAGFIRINPFESSTQVNVRGSGLFDGKIEVIGSGVDFQNTRPNSVLHLNRIVATSGNASVVASGIGSRIDTEPTDFPDSAVVFAPSGTALLQAGKLNIGVSEDGTVLANAQTGVIFANDINLSTLATSNEDIRLAADLLAFGSVSITAHGTGNIVQVGDSTNSIGGNAAREMAPVPVTLRTQQGNIGASDRFLLIEASSLSANTAQVTAGAGVDQNSGVFLRSNPSAPHLMTLGSSTTGNVFQVTHFGNLDVQGNVNGGEIILNTSEDGSITSSGGLLKAGRVELQTQRGSIGSETNFLPIEAGRLEFHVSEIGNVFISERDALSVESSHIQHGDLVLDLSGSLSTVDSSSRISMGGSRVEIIDHSGDVGTVDAPFLLEWTEEDPEVLDNTLVLEVAGNAHVANLAANPVRIEQANVLGDFSFTSPSPVEIGSDDGTGEVVAGGSLAVFAGRDLAVLDGTRIEAGIGSLTLNIDDEQDAVISIGEGARLLIGNGAIRIFAGSDPENGIQQIQTGSIQNLRVNGNGGVALAANTDRIFSQVAIVGGIPVDNEINLHQGNVILNPGPADGSIVLSGNVILQTGNPEVVVLPPGQGGTPPGQGGAPYGLGGTLPPGQGGTNPGNGGGDPPGKVAVHPGGIGSATTTTTSTMSTGVVGSSKASSPSAPVETNSKSGKKVSMNSNSLVPVAFREAFGSEKVRLFEGTTTNADLKHDGTALVSSNSSNEIVLKEGQLMVIAHEDTIVNAANKRVEIEKGTVALVAASDSSFHIVNLYDNSCESILVVDEKNCRHHVSAGQLLSSADPNEFCSALRRVNKASTTTTAEFSFLALAEENHLMKLILKNSGDTKLAKTLMKRAASLHVVTLGHGPYQANDD